jgi:hypothetical protein
MPLPVRPVRPFVILGLVALVALAGCKTQVQGTSYMPPPGEAAPLPRPVMVVVRDFAIDPYAIQVDQGIGGQMRRSMNGASIGDAQQRDASDVQLAITNTLVAQIQAMGLPVQLDTGQLPPGNVLIIQGQVDQVNEGNRTRRNVVGFGAGMSNVSAKAQVLYVRNGGAPQLLQSYQGDANSGRMPGLAAGAAGSVATGSAAGAIVGLGMKVVDAPKTEVGSRAQSMTRRMAVNLGQFFAQEGWIPPSAVPSLF